MKGDIKKLFSKKNIVILALVGGMAITAIIGYTQVKHIKEDAVASITAIEELAIADHETSILVIADLLLENEGLMKDNQEVLEDLYEANQHVCATCPTPPAPVACPPPVTCKDNDPVVCEQCPAIVECVPGIVIVTKEVEVEAICPEPITLIVTEKPKADRFTPYVIFTGVTDESDVYGSVGVDSELFKRKHFVLKVFAQANYQLNYKNESIIQDPYYCEEFDCSQSDSNNIFGTYGLSVRF